MRLWPATLKSQAYWRAALTSDRHKKTALDKSGFFLRAYQPNNQYTNATATAAASTGRMTR